jgi:hypothetical protein
MTPILGIIASSFRSAAGPDGAYDALATVTVPSGGLATITFAGIPNTYKHLQVRVSAKTNRSTYGNDGLYLKVNGLSSNYAQHYLLGDGSSASASGGGSNSQILIGWTGTNVSSAYGANIIDILDYANTTKYKTVRNLGGVDINGTIAGFGGTVALHSGMNYGTTEAINSISFTSSNAANFQEYSQFSLYGVK